GWNCEPGDEGKHDSRISNRIRENHVFGVDEDQRGDRGHKDQIKREGQCQTVVPGYGNEEQAGKRLNRRIASGDMRLAGSAASPDQQITQDWDIVIESNGGSAGGTSRAGQD